MLIKQIIDEDFSNYKKPAMLIAFPTCTWKCERDCGKRVCHNSELAEHDAFDVTYEQLVNRYINNHITSAIVFGGLEPLDSLSDVLGLIYEFRANKIYDDIVIYTGYTEEECEDMQLVDKLQGFNNIVVKFGRYIPHQTSHYDVILGVNLASSNQYGKRICE